MNHAANDHGDSGSRTWVPAYVGIGSNLDDPRAQVERAFAALATFRHSRLIAQSRRYRSAPLGPADQPWFVNAVAGMLTHLEPDRLFAELKRLERELGRAEPVIRWGPRHIDLDLLLYGARAMTTSQLTIPHPGLTTRAFVLYPLADFAPDLLVPGAGRVSELVRGVPFQNLELIATHSSTS